MSVWSFHVFPKLYELHNTFLVWKTRTQTHTHTYTYTHTHTHTYAHAHARTHCPSLCPLLILTYTQMLSRDRAVPVRHPRCHSPSDLEIGLRKRPCVPLSPCVSAN